VQQTIHAPGQAGSYWVFVEADVYNLVLEGAGESDNLAGPAGPLAVGAPDLTVASVSAPSVVSVGAPLAVSWTASNVGVSAATGSWLDRVSFVDTADGSGPRTTLHDQWLSGPLEPGSTAPHGIVATVPAPAGTRFIAVETNAAGNVNESGATANNLVVGNAVTVVAANLVVSAGNAPSSVRQMVNFALAWTDRNDGPGDSWGGCWTDRVYLSSDAVLDDSDREIGSTSHCDAPMAAKATLSNAVTANLPESVAPGTYHVLVKVDAGGARHETSDDDNVRDLGTVEVLRSITPDLVVASVSVPKTAYVGDSLVISWTDRNDGEDTATAWVDRVWISDDAVAGGDAVLLEFASEGPLAPGASRTVTRTVTCPASLGNRWLYVDVDANNNVFENHHEDNNRSALAGPFNVQYRPAPDLVVSAIAAPGKAVATQAVAFSYTVRNAGAQPATGLWREAVYVQTDDPATAGTPVASFWRIGPIAAGAEQVRNETLILPLDRVGTRRFVVKVDVDNAVDEVDPAHEANNATTAATDTVVVDPPLPDLVITGATLPASAVEGDTVTVTFAGRNQGVSTAAGGWTDRVYLSADSVLDASDTLVASRFQGTSITAGGSWAGTVTFAAPATPANAHVIVVADGPNTVIEGTHEDNNAYVSKETIALTRAPRPDLVASIIGTPPAWHAGTTVQVSWRGANGGETPTGGGWSDAVYLSTDATLSADDLVLRQQPVAANVPAGGNYERAVAVNLPVDYRGGQRYLIVRIGMNSAFTELDAANNVAVFGPFDFLPVPAADLAPLDMRSATPTLVFGQPATFAWTDRNSGTVATAGEFTDIVLMSKDATPSGDDLPVALLPSRGAVIAVGASLAREATGSLPLTNSFPEGDYWFYVRTDANANIVESNDDNNVTVIGPFHVVRPALGDLVAEVVSVPS